jgi:hypothetical protein
MRLTGCPIVLSIPLLQPLPLAVTSWTSRLLPDGYAAQGLATGTPLRCSHPACTLAFTAALPASFCDNLNALTDMAN